MFEYIDGKIIEVKPAYAIIEAGNIGYFIHISLTTYEKINNKNNVKLYLHQIVREDAHLLFGFETQHEREVFRLLISVSGVGANTARMMLSSLTPNDIEYSIQKGDVNSLKSIKGIGAKTAQRLIVELKDKVGQSKDSEELFFGEDNTLKDEALSALVMLGFSKTGVEKVLNKILAKQHDLSVEDLIKKALQQL